MKAKFVPQAASEGIVVQELNDEILVCDTKTNKVYCLNQTASEVWRECDGQTEISGIAGRLTNRLNSKFTDELVEFTLVELSKQNLLTVDYSKTAPINGGLSRRETVKRLAIGSAFALPIISSVMMPSAAHAQSSCDPLLAQPNGCACLSGGECDSGCCLAAVCETRQTFFCGGGVDCPAPYICCANFNNGNIDDFNCSCDGIC